MSRGVVADTYDQLTAEGYLETQPRQAPLVAGVGAAPPIRGRPAPPGTSTSSPRRRTWSCSLAVPGRATERALREAPNEAFDYGDHRGRIELRRALSGYLGRVRGVRIEPAADGHHPGLHPGSRPGLAGAPGPRLDGDSVRGPVPADRLGDPRGGRAERGRRAGRSRGRADGRARRARRGRHRRDPGPPVPDGCGDGTGASRRPRLVGQPGGSAHHRGRLRRRVSLRPQRDRGHPGAGPLPASSTSGRRRRRWRRASAWAG